MITMNVYRDLPLRAGVPLDQCLVVGDQTVNGKPTGKVSILHSFKERFSHPSGNFQGNIVIHLSGLMIEDPIGYSLGINLVDDFGIAPINIGGKIWSKEMRLKPSSLIGTYPIGTSPEPYVWSDDGYWQQKLNDAVYYSRYGAISFLVPGWHVATRAEWRELVNFVCGTSVQYPVSINNDNIAKLFSAEDWDYYPEDVQRDAFGFGLRPCGYGADNFRYALGTEICCWTGDTGGNGNNSIRITANSQAGLQFSEDAIHERYAMGIRFVKDY